MKKVSLSKSKIQRGLQCPKSLFLTIHRPELEPPITDAEQAIFEQGREVGRLAQQSFPGGILIDVPYYAPVSAQEETAKAIWEGALAIFEAHVSAQDFLAKIDVLQRDSAQSPWNLIEVKSSTSLKDEHLDDVAIQSYIAELAGLKIGQIKIMHLNRSCRYPHLEDLFVLRDVTDAVKERRPSVVDRMKGFGQMLRGGEPLSPIGPHCSRPRSCSFTEYCWRNIPSPSIFDFPHGGGVDVWELYAKGLTSLLDPRVGPFEGVQATRLAAVKSGVRWVDAKGIQRGLSSWRYPLYHLDFETIGHAIPRFDGTGPYDNVPYQFSVIVEKEPGAESVASFDYLHETETDPREPLAEALVRAIGVEGSVVAYYKAFEEGVLRQLADQFPQYRERLLDIVARLVDPLPIVRNHVYDTAFHGSFSIKAVAPALLGEHRSYEGMAVGDGQAAGRAFLKLIAKETPAEEKRAIKKQMLDYCRQDTTAMMELVGWLRRQTSSA